MLQLHLERNLHYDTLPAATGSFVFTGKAATFALQGAAELDATTGIFVLSGLPLTAVWSHRLSATPGVFTLTSNPATTRRTYKLPVTTGSFALTRNPAEFQRTHQLTATRGTLS